MIAKQTVVIGVVNAQVHDVFAPLMAKGLVRLEGYIKRGKLENVSALRPLALPRNAHEISSWSTVLCRCLRPS